MGVAIGPSKRNYSASQTENIVGSCALHSSYLHCKWATLKELEKDPRIHQKIKRFRTKQAQMKHLFAEVTGAAAEAGPRCFLFIWLNGPPFISITVHKHFFRCRVDVNSLSLMFSAR